METPRSPSISGKKDRDHQGASLNAQGNLTQIYAFQFEHQTGLSVAMVGLTKSDKGKATDLLSVLSQFQGLLHHRTHL